jgi:hypothetical protein
MLILAQAFGKVQVQDQLCSIPHVVNVSHLPRSFNSTIHKLLYERGGLVRDDQRRSAT